MPDYFSIYCVENEYLTLVQDFIIIPIMLNGDRLTGYYLNRSYHYSPKCFGGHNEINMRRTMMRGNARISSGRRF